MIFTSESLGIIYGLASASTWGAGDFSGGIATKHSNVYSVVIFSQSVGLLLLIILAIGFAEQLPSFNDILWGGFAGIAGGIGLIGLYRGLSTGQMSIVAPLSAVIAVIIPMIVSIILEEPPAFLQFFGFGIALLAVWFISQSNQEVRIKSSDIGLIILAGLGFGLFFVFIAQVSSNFVFWPLVVARIFSVSFLLLISMTTKQFQIPKTKNLPVIALAGIFDVGGNVFFVLATQSGRLDISAVLSSLYPAATIILAWIILKETLTNRQIFGIFLVFISIVLITV